MNQMKLITLELEEKCFMQLQKINEEVDEIENEIISTEPDINKALIECMDLITATLNLMSMLGTPEEIEKANGEWFKKMLNYEFSKRYKIKDVYELSVILPGGVNGIFKARKK
jgi:hypothetical protein